MENASCRYDHTGYGISDTGYKILGFRFLGARSRRVKILNAL